MSTEDNTDRVRLMGDKGLNISDSGLAGEGIAEYHVAHALGGKLPKGSEVFVAVMWFWRRCSRTRNRTTRNLTAPGEWSRTATTSWEPIPVVPGPGNLPDTACT